ncbi:TetR/AcrR family transcriptional regulator [Rugosimonospora acidiphila]|uniref:TetR/AcrR family transcriptional regulator n=1 Tax=Rugosimonospora acidiphila TaxID=556531 RepID=A0ABP9RSW4_9ACTN
MGNDNTDAAVALLWGPQAQPRRGPRPTLRLDAIARTGIEIADADGLAAVTMQRVAERLDVTKMALYRYVPGKAELVALMIDLGLGEPPPDDTAHGGWRPVLDDWARRLFARFCQHPWALEAAVGARPIGPNELSWMEHAVAALSGTGLDGGEMLDVVVTLVGHARNLAAQMTAAAGTGGTTGPGRGAAPDASSQTSRIEQAMESSLSALIRGREQRFPALAAALASAVAQGSQDQALDFGLNRILDGIEALLATRR